MGGARSAARAAAAAAACSGLAGIARQVVIFYSGSRRKILSDLIQLEHILPTNWWDRPGGQSGAHLMTSARDTRPIGKAPADLEPKASATKVAHIMAAPTRSAVVAKVPGARRGCRSGAACRVAHYPRPTVSAATTSVATPVAALAVLVALAATLNGATTVIGQTGMRSATVAAKLSTFQVRSGGSQCRDKMNLKRSMTLNIATLHLYSPPTLYIPCHEDV